MKQTKIRRTTRTKQQQTSQCNTKQAKLKQRTNTNRHKTNKGKYKIKHPHNTQTKQQIANKEQTNSKQHKQ